MIRAAVERLVVPGMPRRPLARWLWREWCFARSVLRQGLARLTLLLVLLMLAAVIFRILPSGPGTMAESLYAVWFLVLANPVTDFPAHMALRILTFLLPVLGLVVIIESVVEIALLVRDRRHSEHSWCTTMAKSLRDHIVLVGLGKLGFRTYLMLRKLGLEVVVIEIDDRKEFLDDVRRDSSALLVGDARRDQILVDANVARARAIIAATDNDLTNIEVAFDARRLNPGIRVVLRMFDQTLADKVAGAAEIHVAMSPPAISAPAFAAAAVNPAFVGSAIIEGTLVVTRRVRVSAGGRLAGRTVGAVLGELRMGVIRRTDGTGRSEAFPPPDRTIAAGDELLVQGEYGAVAGVEG
jgi:Trk K+ transport system NAD-binding subunit